MDQAFLDLAARSKQGRSGVLATIVGGRGSTYRKPGASAVIADHGRVIGADGPAEIALSIVAELLAFHGERPVPASREAMDLAGTVKVREGAQKSRGRTSRH